MPDGSSINKDYEKAWNKWEHLRKWTLSNDLILCLWVWWLRSEWDLSFFPPSERPHTPHHGHLIGWWLIFNFSCLTDAAVNYHAINTCCAGLSHYIQPSSDPFNPLQAKLVAYCFPFTCFRCLHCRIAVLSLLVCLNLFLAIGLHPRSYPA